MLFISDDVIQLENFWGFTTQKHIDRITKWEWELSQKVVECMCMFVFEFYIGKAFDFSICKNVMT